jgi:hypothetical protein
MLEQRLQANRPNEGFGETDDLVEVPPSQGDPACTRAGRQSSPGRLQNIKPFGPFHF